MRLMMTLAIYVLEGCSIARPPRATGSDSMNGNWRGSNGGLSVTIALQQSGDSVTGSGNFRLESNASFGCGGESLPNGGSLRMTGHLAAGEFQGRMNFGNAWTPPYLGVVSASDTLRGHFMSVDRGGCPLVLIRER
jgi:hypothetical protein